MTRTLKENLVISAKGIAMGAADIVPGVSGGTIAFITGIYEELINSIRSVSQASVQHLLRFDFTGFWKSINGTFLLFLGLGIGASLISLSRMIVYLLQNQPIATWSFFFGLIVASAIVILTKITNWTIAQFVSLAAGTIIAFWVTLAVPAQTPDALWFIFLSGFVAICAMILPGISGSFILLLMGKYEYILEALKHMNISVILTFILGCVAGLLSFSHILSWLLRKYHDLSIALLAGFMIGSLNKVWPWKVSLLQTESGKDIVTQNLLPWSWEASTGDLPQTGIAVLLAVSGFAVVWLLENLTSRNQVR